ncbi:hypothetical protein UPYG_G00161250 [Umbra pygmaea]|uniref:Ig-like domain-containing protein n=1 Tax=Umbra pygmaea TaxID=75934 RepID=A0ABD0XC28_UMBPY
MTRLVLVWTTVCLWTKVSSLIIESEFVRYPRLNDSESLTCECSNTDCQTVFWFHTPPNNTIFQFLVTINSADRTKYGNLVDQARFKASTKRDVGAKATFTLRILDIKAEDAGLYSCMLRNKKEDELWSPGVLLKPGETRPTSPPTTKPPRQPPVKTKGDCIRSKNQNTEGCESIVRWLLVGVLLTLVVALISTIYYFSRLPKKCQHHFVKKRPLK